MRILDSARKHGIQDQDIEYVYEFATESIVLQTNPEKVMLFGFDTIGRGLEVGYVVNDYDEDIVIHAMKIRSVYKKFLYGQKGAGNETE